MALVRGSGSGSETGSSALTRDLTKAKEAYSDGDVEASRKAHEVRIVIRDDGDGPVEASQEEHAAGGEFVKSLVFGGLDGIITTFAIVSASEGGNLSKDAVILMGLANLVADAISMGLGDYLSETAEHNYIASEQKRETWETENFLEGEVSEMIEIYEGRGMSKVHATELMGILSKYPKIFVENMMVDELGLMPIKDDDDPHEAAKKGLVTFCAFILFGFVPVLVYIISRSVGYGDTDFNYTFLIAAIAAVATLFFLGVCKARLTKQSWFTSGFWMTVNGGMAAAAAFLIGHIIDSLLDVHQSCGDT